MKATVVGTESGERFARPPSFNKKEETSHGQSGHEGGTSQSFGATWGVVSSKTGVGRSRGGPMDTGDVERVDQP